jgi:putative transposase
MAHTRTNLLYHLIFGTKYTKRWIDAELADRLHPYLAGIVKRVDGNALAVNGMEEHVHLLVRIPPTLDVSALLRTLKANSSKWIHETFADKAGFQWQDGFGAFTVSASQVPRVVSYIRNQKMHHKEFDFRGEWAMLCKAHGISFEGLPE